MRLPLEHISKTPIEGVDLQRVKIVERTLNGESLNTGGWLCYTCKDTYRKRYKNDRKVDKYVHKKKASSSNEQRSVGYILGQIQ